MEEEDPHRRPQLNWEKPAEEEEDRVSFIHEMVANDRCYLST